MEILQGGTIALWWQVYNFLKLLKIFEKLQFPANLHIVKAEFQRSRPAPLKIVASIDIAYRFKLIWSVLSEME